MSELNIHNTNGKTAVNVESDICHIITSYPILDEEHYFHFTL